MGRIYAVGETTYDIIFRNDQPTGAIVGGSVLNTSVTLGRLGIPVSFISRMGSDQIGELSLKFLKSNEVNCDFITRYEGSSRLALAFMDNTNNADYQFYKAEKAPDLHFPEITSEDKVVFGSTNALRDEGRNNLLLFLNQAHDKNVLTLYDPNIREFSPLEMIDIRRKFEENLYLTKVLKGSNQDFLRIYETTDVNIIFDKVKGYGVEVLIVTFGSEPVQLRTNTISASFDLVPVNTVSTIGAGDNFTAGLIYGFERLHITTENLRLITELEWNKIISCANLMAGEVCKSELNYVSFDFVEQFKAQQVCV